MGIHMSLGNNKRLKILSLIICILIVILAGTIITVMVKREKDRKKSSTGEGTVSYAYSDDGQRFRYDEEEEDYVALPKSAVVLGDNALQDELVLSAMGKMEAAKLRAEELAREDSTSYADSYSSSEGNASSTVRPDSEDDTSDDKAGVGDVIVDGEAVKAEDIYFSSENSENKLKILEMLGYTKADDENEPLSADSAEDPEAQSDEEPPEEEQKEEIVFLSIYRQGDDDASVAYIQERLMQLGFMDNSEPTEHYGPVTMDAVKRFQRQNELKQDGIIGSETIALLFDDNAKSYLLKKGMDGEDIRTVQKRLYELGYLATLTNISGSYDDVTEQAVKSLQSSNGISADGKIGIVTNELLYSEDVRANLVSFGDKSDIVMECQKKLYSLGYLTTEPDGFYGSDTLAAVKQFQSRNDCIVDGYLGPSTRAALNSSSAKPNGLVLGDESDTVKRVQELLIKYGYMNSGSATGYFGEVTEEAVKNFQKNNGLSADGNVGQKTMAKLTGDSVTKATGNATSGSDSGKKQGGSGSGSSGGGKSDDGGSGITYSGSVDNLISVAKTKIGCPYVWGSKGPNSFDCSGFVYWCLKQVGVSQSYITSYGWRTVGKYKKISDFNSLRKGDVVVVYGHVGLAAGNGTVIDASSSAGEIVYREMGDWWKRNFICGWRIFD